MGAVPEELRTLERIKSLEDAVLRLQSRGTVIPTLEADPGTQDPTNLWFLDDGRLRGRTRSGDIVELAFSSHSHPGITGTPSGGSGSTAPPPPPAYSPSTQVYESGADWAQSYNKGGAQQRSTPYLYYGNSGDSFNGQQMSMIHFPNLGVLAPGPVGTRIAEVYVRITNIHTWFNGGGDLRIGFHNSGAKPGTFQQNRWDPLTVRVGKPSIDLWYGLPAWVGELYRDGLVQGFTFMQNTNDRAFYGYAQSDVRLKIVYVK